MRPYWKGYLKLALVSCPIALHAACSTAERIAFRQINKATGNRLRQQLIDEETREPVPRWEPYAGKLHVRICAGGSQRLATRGRIEQRISALANSVACVNPEP